MNYIDPRKLHSLAVTLGHMSDDAAEEAKRLGENKEFDRAFNAWGRAEGLRQAASLLVDITMQEIA